jgi:predicted nicotinamide N-methyase
MLEIRDELNINVGNLKMKVVAPRIAEDEGDRLTFWWGLTTSEIALARTLVAQRELTGKRILELGCGLGLAGLAAALAGAKVVLTDYMEEALGYARENARLNEVPNGNVTFMTLDWQEPRSLGTFDYIIGSEILYDYFFHRDLRTLLTGCAAAHTEILLADRARLSISRFIGSMLRIGFGCRKTVQAIAVEPLPIQEVTLYSLRRVIEGQRPGLRPSPE